MGNRLMLAAACLAASLGAVAQTDYSGRWEGELMSLPLVLDVARADTAWTATLSSPSQGAFGLPCAEVRVAPEGLSLSVPAIGASYAGRASGDVMRGVFTQGKAFMLTLRRTAQARQPQEEAEQVDYQVSEVVIPSPCGVLAGTLTMPPAPSVGLVLVSGSGPQNRDEELAGHKPFAVLADSLSRNGVAVLRYDDRGVGGSTPGKPGDTTLDLARDALAAVQYLRALPETAGLKIGMLGHSEGGTIAFINAAEHSEEVDFVISLAGAAVKGRDLLVKQNHAMAQAAGHPLDAATSQALERVFDVLDSAPEAHLRQSLERELAKVPGMTAEAAAQQADAMTSPWYVAFVRLDPKQYLKRVKCPVLALNGDFDYQVDAQDNLGAIKQYVPQATTFTLANLNHMMQWFPLIQKAVDYTAPVPTPDPAAVSHIVRWVKGL